MKAQVSFEALVNIGLLMCIMAMIVWSVDARSQFLSGQANLDFFESVCRSIKNSLTTVWSEPNVTVTTFFDSSFNISFSGGYGVSISREEHEGLCSLFTDRFVNESGNSFFMIEVVDEISFLNDDYYVVVS